MNNQFLKPLESSRLLYRSFEMADAKQVYDFLQEKEIIDNAFRIPYPYEKGMAEGWISSHEEELKKGHYTYAVILKEEKVLIGAIELITMEESQHAEAGAWLGKPYWGKGYATEMLSRMLQFGFEELHLHRIYGEYFDLNQSSARVMEKNGMILEGKLREHRFKYGQFFNSNIRGILKNEWEGIKKGV